MRKQEWASERIIYFLNLCFIFCCRFHRINSKTFLLWHFFARTLESCLRCKCIKAWCKVNWDYGLTMCVANLNCWFSRIWNLFHFMRILSLFKFSTLKERFVFIRCINLELLLHVEVGCRTILQTKPCRSLNLAWLITAKALMKSSLEWATIELVQTQEFVLIFTTIHHKAKLSQWITKEKSFPSWRVRADADARQRWRVPSSELTRPRHAAHWWFS